MANLLALSIRRDRSLFAMFFFYDGTLLGLGVTRSSNKLPMFVGIRFEKVITEVLAFCVCLSRRKRWINFRVRCLSLEGGAFREFFVENRKQLSPFYFIRIDA